MATGAAQHQCPFCLSRYSRQEHLQRHLVSHGSNSPFRCEFCTSSFKRGDVLQRHFRTCKRKIQHDLGLKHVAHLSHPSRRRACDRCVRQKRACNFGKPCKGCTGRIEPCTYPPAQRAASPNPMDYFDGDVDEPLGSVFNSSSFITEPAAMDFTFSSLTWQDYYNFETHPIHSRYQWQPPYPSNSCSPFRFSFLANFTSTTGFVSSFDCGPANLRGLVGRNIQVEAGSGEEYCSIHNSEGDSFRALPEDSTDEEIELAEEVPHIWGCILPGQPPSAVQTVDSRWQRREHIIPQFTTNWMQNRHAPFFVEHFPSAMTPRPSQNLKADFSLHRQWLSDRLALKTHEIVSRIKEVVYLKPRNSVIVLTWSSLLEEMCLQFFSPPNLRKFTTLYWACWHPNWPVIHKPTFSLFSAQPALLAAMVLIGACLSSERSDIENARIWFDSVEEMAFSDEAFCNKSLTGSGPQMTFVSSDCRPKVQALQAAYAVCLYQNWEGPDNIKRRVRRYLYSTVVAAARDLGLGSGNHEVAHLEDIDNFEWYDFAVREELIRTFTYIYLLDTAFVMFNNLPPRMVIKELKTDMTCPESCFQALTAEECFKEINAWRSSKRSSRRVTLCSAVETICKKNVDQETREIFADLGVLNLFSIISAVHLLIFQYQSSFGYEAQLVPIRNALANWKEIWLLHVGSNGGGDASIFADIEKVSSESLDYRDMWKRIGFMRNAPEFWLLAKIVLDRLESTRHIENETVEHPFGPGRDCWGSPSLGSSVLDKYDETSMSQVHDLIVDFQRLNMEVG